MTTARHGHATSPKGKTFGDNLRALPVNDRRRRPPAQGRIRAAPLPAAALRQRLERDRERDRITDEQQLAVVTGGTLYSLQAKFGLSDPFPT